MRGRFENEQGEYRNDERAAKGADAGRRRFLASAGWLMLAVPAAPALLAACGSGDQGTPAPPAGGTPEPPSGGTPEPPSAGVTPEPPAPPEPPSAGGGEPAADALVTDVVAAAAMVQALQYVNESAKADQRCENCQLFTAGSDGKGKCQLFPVGLVTSGGWCSSWAQKVTS